MGRTREERRDFRSDWSRGFGRGKQICSFAIDGEEDTISLSKSTGMRRGFGGHRDPQKCSLCRGLIILKFSTLRTVTHFIAQGLAIRFLLVTSAAHSSNITSLPTDE